jgi:acyl carrier protein
LAHYSAANQFLDALACYRAGLRLPALSIDWGEWDETRSLTPEQRGFFERSGLVPMDSNLAFDAMFRLSAGGAVHCMVADIDASLLKPAFEFRGPRPFLKYLTPAAPRPAAARDIFTGFHAGEPREIFAERVAREVAQVLGIDSSESIERERGLFDMGMDSLMSVQLRKRLEAEFGRTLPKMLTFTYPTVAALTEYLVDLERAGERSSAVKKATARASAVSELPEEMSDAEARALLLQELGSLPMELKD